MRGCLAVQVWNRTGVPGIPKSLASAGRLRQEKISRPWDIMPLPGGISERLGDTVTGGSR